MRPTRVRSARLPPWRGKQTGDCTCPESRRASGHQASGNVRPAKSTALDVRHLSPANTLSPTVTRGAPRKINSGYECQYSAHWWAATRHSFQERIMNRMTGSDIRVIS
jgi:hypothetical protein